MRTFRNNNRRSRFRSNDRNYKRNGEVTQKFNSEFSSNSNFQRKFPGKNNHNAPKLIEKYNDLAREALSHGDKILSESYFQHADHFTRILNEQENFKKTRFYENKDNNSNNLETSSSKQENTQKNIDENDEKNKEDLTEIRN